MKDETAPGYVNVHMMIYDMSVTPQCKRREQTERTNGAEYG